ncbi:unnamed protein product [Cyclocybe aegerita]|uniref:Uncharacterized protein n=1 Tax=Cyclocybe aegerita TaxID=1973307 RepID=A0A8S0W7I8_CYCAE|nr:unnamed protein product [Cyclocybe aegerita]
MDNLPTTPSAVPAQGATKEQLENLAVVLGPMNQQDLDDMLRDSPPDDSPEVINRRYQPLTLGDIFSANDRPMLPSQSPSPSSPAGNLGGIPDDPNDDDSPDSVAKLLFHTPNTVGRIPRHITDILNKAFEQADNIFSEAAQKTGLTADRVVTLWGRRKHTTPKVKTHYWNVYEKYFAQHMVEERNRLGNPEATCRECYTSFCAQPNWKERLDIFADLALLDKQEIQGDRRRAFHKYIDRVNSLIQDGSRLNFETLFLSIGNCINEDNNIVKVQYSSRVEGFFRSIRMSENQFIALLKSHVFSRVATEYLDRHDLLQEQIPAGDVAMAKDKPAVVAEGSALVEDVSGAAPEEHAQDGKGGTTTANLRRHFVSIFEAVGGGLPGVHFSWSGLLRTAANQGFAFKYWPPVVRFPGEGVEPGQKKTGVKAIGALETKALLKAFESKGTAPYLVKVDRDAVLKSRIPVIEEAPPPLDSIHSHARVQYLNGTVKRIGLSKASVPTPRPPNLKPTPATTQARTVAASGSRPNTRSITKNNETDATRTNEAEANQTKFNETDTTRTDTTRTNEKDKNQGVDPLDPYNDLYATESDDESKIKKSVKKAGKQLLRPTAVITSTTDEKDKNQGVDPLDPYNDLYATESDDESKIKKAVKKAGKQPLRPTAVITSTTSQVANGFSKADGPSASRAASQAAAPSLPSLLPPQPISNTSGSGKEEARSAVPRPRAQPLLPSIDPNFPLVPSTHNQGLATPKAKTPYRGFSPINHAALVEACHPTIKSEGPDLRNYTADEVSAYIASSVGTSSQAILPSKRSVDFVEQPQTATTPPKKRKETTPSAPPSQIRPASIHPLPTAAPPQTLPSSSVGSSEMSFSRPSQSEGGQLHVLPMAYERQPTLHAPYKQEAYPVTLPASYQEGPHQPPAEHYQMPSHPPPPMHHDYGYAPYAPYGYPPHTRGMPMHGYHGAPSGPPQPLHYPNTAYHPQPESYYPPHPATYGHAPPHYPHRPPQPEYARMRPVSHDGPPVAGNIPSRDPSTGPHAGQ